MRLRAFVVKDGDVDEDTLKSHVKENLARYKVPREFIFLDELPAQRDRQGAEEGPQGVRRGGEPAGVTSGSVRRGWHDGAMTLAIGDPAPDFTLKDQYGQDITLSSYAGRKAVLLVFYPFAFSGVCTGELTGLRDRLGDFETDDTHADGDQLRPDVRPARGGRPGRPVLPAAQRLLAPRSDHEGLRRVRRNHGFRNRSSFAVDKEGRVGWMVHNSTGEARDLDEHAAGLAALV